MTNDGQLPTHSSAMPLRLLRSPSFLSVFISLSLCTNGLLLCSGLVAQTLQFDLIENNKVDMIPLEQTGYNKGTQEKGNIELKSG